MAIPIGRLKGAPLFVSYAFHIKNLLNLYLSLRQHLAIVDSIVSYR